MEADERGSRPYYLATATKAEWSGYEELRQKDKRAEARKPQHPPILKRFVESLCFVLGGFRPSFFGWEDTNNDREVWRCSLIIVGLLFSAAVLELWFSTFN